MEKVYNPKQIEDKIYKEWEDSGFFNPDRLPSISVKQRKTKRETIRKVRRKSTFSIVMPPPNVTGTLHVGHAVMLALQDIMIRYHRMKGDDVLWLPGTDHAAIATQTKVEKLLKEKTGKTRYDLGREKFLKEVEKFVEQSKNIIRKQIRKMGSSCDWSREAYTLDEVRSQAVREVFKKMYDDGLIYRGDRVVNWCPRCGSTLADDEVEYKEEDGKLYYIKYILNSKHSSPHPFPFSRGKVREGVKNLESIIVATTRPETKLGDTAVAVNPTDKRYKKYVGKEFDIDLAGHKIHIKFIADRAIDPKFGTGAVGITPAHSMVDWEMAEKNKLPRVQVIDENGKMTDKAGKYKGFNIFEAREKFIIDLKKAGLLEKIEDYKHNVGYCYRCNTVVEQLPSKQWFISVSSKFKVQSSKLKGFKKGDEVSLKDLAVGVVKNGQIKIIPKWFEKVFFHWMKNLRDWCISRQIWFGHQIPVWYKGDEICVDIKLAKGKDWEQDKDTLDTWFSSGLWTFSTLLNKNFEKYKTFKDWIKNSPDLKRFHPTSVMETGYDILFFWVARMILMTTYVLGEIPFEKVYLHGLIRDEKGRKMSKSLGNVIDPLEVSEKYGTDAVRLSLVIGTAPGNDLILSEEKIAGFRNFANKLWNIGRYIIFNFLRQSREPSTKSGQFPISNKITNYKLQITKLSLTDKWILSRLNSLIAEVTEDLENFRFSQAGEKLRAFTWDEFADWYIEISKIERNFQQLSTINHQLLKLWHPFMPFVTEQLWKELGEKEFLMVSDWPKANKKLINKKVEKNFRLIQSIVKSIRNLRAEFKIDPAKFVNVVIVSKKSSLIKKELKLIKHLARVKNLDILTSGKKPKGSVSAVVEDSEIYLLLEGLVDIKKERERIEKELEEINKYLIGIENKLKNKNFVTRAPKEVVEREKLKLKETQERIKKLRKHLKNL